MKLRNRTLLAIASTLIISITILYFFSAHILYLNIQQAERRETVQQIDNFLYVLKYAQTHFNQTLYSWSTWDDTYQFVDDLNPNYISSNLTLSMMETSNVDFMLFFNKSGKYVYGLGFGHERLKEEDISDVLQQQLVVNGQLQLPWNAEESVMGLISLPTNPLLIAAYPIYPTENKGVSNGHLIVGKVLDATYWLDLSKIIQHTLTVNSVHSDNLPIDFRDAFQHITPEETKYANELSDGFIGGYTTIPDIYSKPLLIIRLLVPRKTYQAGQRNLTYMLIAVVTIGLILLFVILFLLEQMILKRLSCLINEVSEISITGDLSKRISPLGKDEFSTLSKQVNTLLNALQQSQTEIMALNTSLHTENLRMSAELEVSRRIQYMVLPKNSELKQLSNLEIALSMHTATEVGGDYCDVFQQNGHIICGIGDVTGHGLESGVVMLMVQSALRALFVNDTKAPKQIWNALNQMVYQNVRRMQSDKNLSLLVLDYFDGKVRLMGQHEEVLILRQDKMIERIDTFELGFVIGLLEDDMSEFVQECEIRLAIGEGIVLFTDGITEAENEHGEFYGIDRLCQVIEEYKHASASLIQQAVMDDLNQYIGNAPVYDDITLVVLKRCN
ncbi:SpoIIE family protein phosphatase [Beggiatoa leptomitoformis]|uniref:SpoIIE family protein phosphatase n=1 Tax=Beggiatoa leptomitoformis TaxID=288004 RepID=A0A2N9YHK4_9GAMM|nr:SpoIIE family protein phosphatase [Beggiatoa leptomitoformis]AUI69964.1 SpoIIE family protein phosphatase [Beggiatoa leptomitoformis]QGX03654.1 SpoIIE family protein phosphatase [Beggiatoa leptomitoformis]